VGISLTEFEQRYSAIRRRMKEREIDCLLVAGTADDFNRGNVRYLTGSGRGGLCILGPAGAPVLLTGPGQRSNPKLRRTVEALDLLELAETADPAGGAVKGLSRFYRGNRVGIAGLPCITVPVYLAVKERFGDRVVDIMDIFEELREVKSAGEIERTRTAAAVADAVYAALRGAVRPGLGEYEIYGLVKKTIYEMGCEYSFDLIDAAGATMNMSFFPTADRLEAGGTLFMEITPAYEGYYAQLPVTLPVDRYPPRVGEMVEAWHAADAAARQVLRPGTKVSELYRVLTGAVRDRGFISPYRPGHAIGLDALDFWSITETNDRPLRPGMVLAVHPSVLLEPGGDGCGMGYTYLITETGAERLSRVDLAADLLDNQ
jgi:Xaa-Pro aminopeptidase